MGEEYVPTDVHMVASQIGTCLASDSFARPAFTLEQIRTFLVVASREHITRAARALGLSQPAVTQQVHLLERALGVPLLERLGRGVRLTAAGEEIASACLLVMRALENLERTARTVQGLEGGSLAMGAGQVAASYYLSPVLTAFSAAHPAVNVDIVTAPSDDVCERVSAGILDFGLVDGPVPKTKLSCVQVANDEVILAAHPAHPLAGQERIPADGLAGTTCLLWDGSAAEEAIPARILGAPYQALRRIRLANIEAARRTLLADPLFVAALPRVAIADDIEGNKLATIGCPLMRPICAVRRPGNDLGSVERTFWAVLAGMQRRAASGTRTANGKSE